MQPVEWIVRKDGQLDAATIVQARTAGTLQGVAMLVQYILPGHTSPSIEQFVMPPELAKLIGQGLLDAADELDGSQRKPN